MNDVPGPGTFLKLLIQSMAELSQRLRHFPSVPGDDVPPCIFLPRLKVAARLLGYSEGSDPNPWLLACGREMEKLIQEIEDLPQLETRELEPVLEQLSCALEALFYRMDRGEKPNQIFEDPVWLTVISHLANAGSPMEVMDQLDQVARNWENRWSNRDLNLQQDRDLYCRWLTFREYGDAMFGKPDSEDGISGQGRQVVVLLEGKLRREQVQRKLLDRGFLVRVTQNLADAETWISEDPSASIVFCDNLEPSKHLLHLAKKNRGQNAGATLILVTGSGPEKEQSHRARSFGASGIWSEPFTSNPLMDLFLPEN